MATTLEKLTRANRWRIRSGKLGTSEVDGWNGAFLVPIDGQVYFVMISDGWGWRHLSISNAQRKVMPPWSTMCRVKACFFSDDAYVVQFFVPKDEHINDHPCCLHLWESIDAEMPHPSFALV